MIFPVHAVITIIKDGGSEQKKQDNKKASHKKEGL